MASASPQSTAAGLKLSVIVPVFNERGTVAELLHRVEKVPLEKEIIVVDDGSTDGTRDILKQFESRQGFTVLYHEKNGGKGRAIRTGLEAVTGAVVVIQDADLEYDPNDFIEMIRPFLEGRAKAVFGSRRMRKENKQYSGAIYYAGGVFLSWVTSILYGVHITDEPTCYKMIDAQLLKSLGLTSERFEFCPEVTAKLAKRRVPILEVPITYMPRHKDEGKKIGWKDAVEAMWTLFKFRFRD
jgi:glycosyltransferase involved in cell wall biosynthesis